MKRIYIDVETTGLNYGEDRITELAAIYDDGENTNIFHAYCKVDIPIPEIVQELTGITPALLEEKGIPEDKLFYGFKKWLGKLIDPYNKKDKAFFYAYNAPFDTTFIRQLFKRNNDKFYGSWFYTFPVDILGTAVICVTLGLIDPPVNFKNETVCNQFNINIDKAHSAIEDIKASKTLQERLEELIKGGHVRRHI